MGINLKTDNKGYSTGIKVVYFFLIPSPVDVSSGVSTKWKWKSLETWFGHGTAGSWLLDVSARGCKR